MRVDVGMQFRILAFEDDPADLLLLKEALRLAGVDYELQVARGSDEALAVLRRLGTAAHCCPDAILMDLQLVDIDGYELLLMLHERNCCMQTPIMVLTSCLSCRQEERVRSLGVKYFVRKPTNLHDFLKIGTQIRDLLEVAR